jgi:hypothetical protein
VHLGDCKSDVAACVDAQKAFGGMIRTTYTARMEYDPVRGTWNGRASILE